MWYFDIISYEIGAVCGMLGGLLLMYLYMKSKLGDK